MLFFWFISKFNASRKSLCFRSERHGVELLETRHRRSDKVCFVSAAMPANETMKLKKTGTHRQNFDHFGISITFYSFYKLLLLHHLY